MTELQKRRSECSEECHSHEPMTHEDVKDYYGKKLQKSSDLKTNACIAPAKPVPAFIRNVLAEVHPEVTSRYYGCGLVVPECLEHCRLLDLGCGSGRDCYMLSRLVGEKGHITGIDMTEEQLEVARKHIGYHTQKFGFSKPNVEFVHGYIEALTKAGLEASSYDVIISNCVVNLSQDKTSVLREAFRVLKDGGELYFSDIYSSSRLPEEIRSHKVLWGECLGGALWWEDLMRLAAEVGFSTPRLVTANTITVGNKELESLLGDYKFVSATYRLFKIPKNAEKKDCLVIYNGNITGFEKSLEFDCHYTFKENEMVKVDGEVASILKNSRFEEEFTFQPDAEMPLPGSCCVSPKVVLVNPFELAEKFESASVSPATGGCCGTQASCCK
ncbi:arsenite methyltransferase [Megalops cyprinoides]|uniref:arsenite methyltransferase n=1 Tax=Megalops cyprinoides TaxID=118141 RepID=UPI00186408BF|nr:arsenite methyltransferase [Megalops cyprinoides]